MGYTEYSSKEIIPGYGLDLSQYIDIKLIPTPVNFELKKNYFK